MNTDTVLKILRRRIVELGSQTALAAELRVSDAYLSDVLRGRKEPGAKILEPLGLEKVINYQQREQRT